jgi:hypothetical protein
MTAQLLRHALATFLFACVFGIATHAQTPPIPQTGAPIVADGSSSSGQSVSSIYVDTSKLSSLSGGTTPDVHIAYCLANYTNPICDASQDKGTVAATINITQSNVTLILGGLVAPTGVALLNISGTNNNVYCAQQTDPLSNPTLDAHNYGTTGTTPVVTITGNGNSFHGCSIQGSYLATHAAVSEDCIKVGSLSIMPQNVRIESNQLQYCGNNGIESVNASRILIRGNRIIQSFGAGINVNATGGSGGAPQSYQGEISENFVIDTELQYSGSGTGGNGNINFLSSGAATAGALQGWLIHDNVVTNTSPLCNSSGLSTDHGCSEGIQLLENAWDVHVYGNYVYNIGSEGIVLCQYNCSATNNYVGDAGQINAGTGAILQSVQTSGIGIGNTVVSGNTIWNDTSTTMDYCMWLTVATVSSGTTSITNSNWIGNTCAGINGGVIKYGFFFNDQNSSTGAGVTLSGVNLIGNTVDPVTVGPSGTGGAPILETYSTHVTGKIFHGFNNIYGALTGSPLLNLPTPGDLAFYDPNSGTNDSYNLLDAVGLNYNSGTDTLTVGVTGTTSGTLGLAGSTSGAATLTAPAVAGMTTNPVVSSNSISAPALISTGVAGTTSGTLSLAGSTSGTVTIQPEAAAGSYNFNLPTSAGSSGQPLLSGGGGTTAMSFGTITGSTTAFVTGNSNFTSSNSGTIVTIDSNANAQSSGTLMYQKLVVSSAPSNSSTTMDPIFGTVSSPLGFTLNAGTTYNLHCGIIYEGANTSAGISFGFSGPASPTAVDYSLILALGTSAGARYGAIVGNSYTSTTAVDVVSTSTPLPATLDGTFILSTSGTLIPQFASNSTNQVTVEAGSYCILL